MYSGGMLCARRSGAGQGYHVPDRGPRATLKARLRSRPKELQHSYAGLSSGITTTLHKRGELRRDTQQSTEALHLWWKNEL